MEFLSKSVDASDWKLKGEGNANIILSYQGQDVELQGFVVRVRKLWVHESAPKGAKEHSAHSIAKSQLEGVVWDGVLDQTGDRSDLDLEFLTRHLVPILGAASVHPGVPVVAPLGAMKFLDSMGVLKLAESADLKLPALLLPDHTAFTPAAVPKGWKQVGPSVCLELKPKCGFMPSDCPYLAPSNELKRTVPRFTMHQILKAVKTDKGHALSNFSPVDLFSNDIERMNCSLIGLLDAPNNNMRVFVDGDLVFGSVHVGEVSCSRDGLREKIRDAAVRHNVQLPIANETEIIDELMIQLVIEMLKNDGVLDRLLELQKLDKIDVEGVYPLYNRLLADYEAGKVGDTCKEVGKEAAPPLVGTLPMDVPLDQWSHDSATAAIRGYLAAATGKDCGVMVTLQRVEVDESAKDVTACHTPKARLMEYVPEEGSQYKGAMYMYKISFVDLEVKLASKIPKHYELDQSVVKCALENPDMLEKLIGRKP